MKILVTGAAGFIGMNLIQRLVNEYGEVYGLDNLNDYYDVELKKARLKQLSKYKNFNFYKLDVANALELEMVFKKIEPDLVVHLAAQAGVRYSIENPQAYAHSNLQGFFNVLNCCKLFCVEHLLYASSSSVYGLNAKNPSSEVDSVDQPMSLYAATKRSNELMAYSYSHLFKLPTTGLRFFSVYGPWGRPDMAYYIFTRSILNNQPIKIFNNGNMKRDFTYIDDITESIIRLLRKPPSVKEVNDGLLQAPYNIFNIGNSNTILLNNFIEILEDKLNKKAIKNYYEIQQGDMANTCADVRCLKEWINFSPKENIEDGLEKFIFWYKNYHV